MYSMTVSILMTPSMERIGDNLKSMLNFLIHTKKKKIQTTKVFEILIFISF